MQALLPVANVLGRLMLLFSLAYAIPIGGSLLFHDGIVVDFVNKGSTHTDRVISLHSLLDADFYREGARVTPVPAT